ncbi:MAG: hypothetical protein JSS76_10835 [Bacteroidetes bacterium]|nr:hypothetical protein [Bacteroidota bacterium]
MKKIICSILFTCAVFLFAHASLPNSDQAAAPNGLSIWVGGKNTGPNGVYSYADPSTWGGGCIKAFWFCLQYISSPNSSVSDYISVNKDLTTTLYVNKAGHSSDLSSIIADGYFTPTINLYVYPQILADQKVDVSAARYVASGHYAASLSSDGAYYIVNVGKLTTSK